MERAVEQIHPKFPFGAWNHVHEEDDLQYTGKRLRIVVGPEGKREVHVDMSSFITGRMDLIDVPGAKMAPDEQPASAIQHAEYRSAVGCLHWVVSQCRLDIAYEVNVLQKRQSAPTAGDLRRAKKVMRDVQ
eukprot:2865451-Amphidinium_carterae.1